jgi:hypothetical protein
MDVASVSRFEQVRSFCPTDRGQTCGRSGFRLKHPRKIPGFHQLIRVVGFMRTMKPTHSNMHNPGLHATSVLLRPHDLFKEQPKVLLILVEPVPSLAFFLLF